MKKLFTSLCLLMAVGAYAQQSEIGLSFGVSTNSRPFGTNAYRGDQLAANNAISATYLYNLNKTWQLGAEVCYTELSRRASKPIPWHGEVVGNDGKKYEYAHASYAFTPTLNAKFAKWEGGYAYGGITAGFVVARDYITNGGASGNASDGYVGPDGGIGEEAGIQLGVSAYVSRRFSLNLQGAVRYYNLTYGSTGAYYYPGKNYAYGMWVYPVLAGVRYDFGFKKHINAQTGKSEITPSDRSSQ